MTDVVLSLCDESHVWGGQYADAYDVRFIDLLHGQDIRTLEYIDGRVHGIIAQPPCRHLANSGSRFFKSKGHQVLLDSLALVDACLRAVAIYRPYFWVLENPVGRLSRFLGPPAHTYHPNHYGDAYTKLTCLWGEFTMPQPVVNMPEPDKNYIQNMPGTGDVKRRRRAVTPPGFAGAFRRYNP